MSSTEIRDAVIRRGAVRLRLGVIVAMIALGVSILLAWTGPVFGHGRIEIESRGGLIDPRLSGTAAILLTVIALFRLTQMLKAIASGDMFSSRVVRHFRGFAFWLLALAIFGVAGPILGSFLEETPTINGKHSFALALDLDQILAVGVTLLLFLLARLLDRARAIDEEMRAIV